MTSTLLSGSVKHSPAAVGGGHGFSVRATPHHGGNTCRFGFKRPAASTLHKVSASSTITAADEKPSPPSDLTDSPAPLLLLPPILLDKDKYQLGHDEDDRYFFFSWSKKELITVEKNHKSWRRNQIRDAHWVGSSKGWIMYMTRTDSNLFLCNPFSPSAPIIPLPPIETLSSVAVRNFRLRRSDRSSGELDVEFLLEDWYDTTDPSCRYYSGTKQEFKAYIQEKRKKKWFEVSLPFRSPATSSPEDLVNRGFISKIALSSAPASSSSPKDLRNCIVAIVYGLSRRLAICRLGDRAWTHVDGLNCRDLIFSRHDNSKLFLDTWFDGIKWCKFNFGNLSSSSPKWNDIGELEFHRDMTRHFLVESATDPNHLSIVRSSYTYDAMDIHELDLSDAKQNWERVDCLDDQALFIGTSSETVTVPAVRPNYIYVSNFDCFEVCVYSLEERNEDLEQSDGPCLDLSFKKKQRSRKWEEAFRKKAHGWALWVTPNHW